MGPTHSLSYSADSDTIVYFNILTSQLQTSWHASQMFKKLSSSLADDLDRMVIPDFFVCSLSLARAHKGPLDDRTYHSCHKISQMPLDLPPEKKNLFKG